MSRKVEFGKPITPTELVDVEKTPTPLYNGEGTEEDHFVVEFQKDDPHNPMNWSLSRKWFITAIVTLSVFAITLTSSAYSESTNEVIGDFDISTEVFTSLVA
jgi:hypothetical protein